MKTKFESGDRVIFQEQEQTVLTSSKHFPTGAIRYRLDNGQMVAEKELKLAEEKKVIKSKVDDSLIADYEKYIGKPVPTSKKNDTKWIQSKVDEVKAKTKKPETKFTMDEVMELDGVGELSSFIETQQLAIDPEDYESEDDLRLAIAEELGIK